jgi:DNA polymerase
METAMSTPKPINNSTTDTVTLLEEPLEVHLRGRTEPGATRQSWKKADPVSSFRAVLNARGVGGMKEPVISWDAKATEQIACVVDIDVPKGGTPLPAHTVISQYFPESLPRPLCAFRSHGGGLKAIFVTVAGVPALDLASAWYLLAPLGEMRAWRAEVGHACRHPRGTRVTDGRVERCGPIAWFAPSARMVLPKETAAEATEDEVAHWLATRDLEMGRRSAANCPMPACGQVSATSGSDPIDINDRGIRCYRCSRFAGWGRLVHGSDGLAPLALAARERVHLGHQRTILAATHPHADPRLLRQGWWALLHAAAGCFPPPENGAPDYELYVETKLPLMASAMSSDLSVVRAVDNTWRQESSLLRREITTLTARALPWATSPVRVDEALDAVPLRGFQTVHAVNHGLLLPPDYRTPSNAILVRRGAALGELPAVDISRRPSTQHVAEAWEYLEQRLPGLHRGYLSALIAAALHAHLPTGMPPIAVVTGGSGSGKNTTIEIAASVVGTTVANCKLSEAKETLRDMGLALEHGSTLLNFNEVGRVKDTYSKLEAILRVGKTFRYDAKYKNEVSAPFTAGMIFTGSTLPASIVRGPELVRRAVGWRLTAPDGDWRKQGDLTQSRQVPGLGAPLEIIAADVWWLLVADRRPWDTLAREHFGGVGLAELDLEDIGGEARDETLRLLYETYRKVPEASFIGHHGGPEWLTLSRLEAAMRALASLVDLEQFDRAEAVMHDLQRVELGPVLGFTSPRFVIMVRRHGAEWRLKVAQTDVMRGAGLPRSQWPEASKPENGTYNPRYPITSNNRLPSRVVAQGEDLNEIDVTHIAHVTQAQPSGEDDASFESAEVEAGGVTCVTAKSPQKVVAIVRAGATVEVHHGEGRAASWRASENPTPGVVEMLASTPVIVTSERSVVTTIAGLTPSSVVVDATDAARITGFPVRGIVGDVSPTTLIEVGERFAHQALPFELEVLRADRAINSRGMQIDIELARDLAEVGSWFTMLAQSRAPIPTTSLVNPERLRDALRDAGLELPDVRGGTLEAALDDPDLTADARQIIMARTATAGNTQRKLAAALAGVDEDSRLRETLVYAGASTGRWSGRGFQPQNLPHSLGGNIDPIIQAVREHDVIRLRAFAKQQAMSVPALLRGLVRSIIVAADGQFLIKADQRQLEPRVLAWLAEDTAKLTRLRDPNHDIYADLAADMLGIAPQTVTPAQRLLGKVGELGCGYGMGPDRTREYGIALGIDWNTTTFSPTEVVTAWRRANPKVAAEGGVWESYEFAFQFAAAGDAYEVYGVQFDRDGKDVLVELPSGRRVRYRNVECARSADGRTETAIERRGRRVRMWGAKLTENIVQAVGRDVHAEKLVDLEANGLEAVLHVHDDVVVETSEETDAAAIEYLLTQPPKWAPELPLAVEITVGRRYT